MSDLTIEQRLARWALSGDTGTSSETLACAIMGIPDTSRRFGFDVPHDYSDFGRCHRLVQQVPEILEAWDKVVAACPAWAPVAKCWDELVACYESDSTTGLDTCRPLLRKLAEEYQLSKVALAKGSGTWRNP